MAEGKSGISWGKILLGAALVTGIAAAAVFMLAPTLTGLATATAVTGVTTVTDTVGAAAASQGFDAVASAVSGANAVGAQNVISGGIASNVGTAILQAVGKAAEWATNNTGAILGIGAATGAVIAARSSGNSAAERS
ncbi:MAG: hypothetical protein EBR02_07615 [Alphaproteobacteria bacterium]|nr:hypothetical protein [Alphaproteobacteria bacterium]